MTGQDHPPLDATTDAYYLPLGGDVFQPTLRVQGAWQPFEQHMAPVAGLLAHVMEAHDPRPDLQLSRVTYEILGMIPALPSAIRVATIRPGRTIELVEATLSVAGKDVVRATGWRLSRQDTAEVAGGFWEPLPGPQTLDRWDGTSKWGGGYIASLEFRAIPGGQPGNGSAWIRTRTPLVHEVEVSPVAQFVTLVDTANGIAARAHPSEWMFPNTDLTIHLFRTPTPGWVGFDTEVIFGETGVGLTSSKLYDERGAVGRSEQILTVRELPRDEDRRTPSFAIPTPSFAIARCRMACPEGADAPTLTLQVAIVKFSRELNALSSTRGHQLPADAGRILKVMVVFRGGTDWTTTRRSSDY